MKKVDSLPNSPCTITGSTVAQIRPNIVAYTNLKQKSFLANWWIDKLIVDFKISRLNIAIEDLCIYIAKLKNEQLCHLLQLENALPFSILDSFLNTQDSYIYSHLKKLDRKYIDKINQIKLKV